MAAHLARDGLGAIRSGKSDQRNDDQQHTSDALSSVSKKELKHGSSLL
jgi:hypothetical protein